MRTQVVVVVSLALLVVATTASPVRSVQESELQSSQHGRGRRSLDTVFGGLVDRLFGGRRGDRSDSGSVSVGGTLPLGIALGASASHSHAAYAGNGLNGIGGARSGSNSGAPGGTFAGASASAVGEGFGRGFGAGY